MKKSLEVLRIGTRSSKLAIRQTENSCKFLKDLFNEEIFKIVQFSSPGDRDKKTDLRTSTDDFFTKDLDDAVLSGELDCAMHSAKDIIYPVKNGLDWFWLPVSEDPRDVFIISGNRSIDELPENIKIGISSDRREEWCKEKFPRADLIPIRGNIDERLEQLDAGKFDLILMAAAALNRLGLSDRISGFISESELAVPEGQGWLCITFKEGNEKLKALRSLFMKPVEFVGAGCGDVNLITVKGAEAISQADIILYDALIDKALLNNSKLSAKKISVGKRCGAHSVPQEVTNELIAEYSRQGKKVVRLKGGDPAIFGRLEEELELMNRFDLPYIVIPGISSLTGATLSSGMILTGRNIAPGFTVMTPREKGGGTRSVSSESRDHLPLIFFMSIRNIELIVSNLLEDGYSGDTLASVVFNGGTDQEISCYSTLKNIEEDLKKLGTDLGPGLIVIGKSAKKIIDSNIGALGGKKVLITASNKLLDDGKNAVKKYNGTPILYPIIETAALPDLENSVKNIENFEWVVITSPTCVDLFFKSLYENKIDLRKIKKIAVAGKKSASLCRSFGIKPDLIADSHNAGESLSNELCRKGIKDSKILRLRSEKAGDKFSNFIIDAGAIVSDVIAYKTEYVKYDKLPEFDSVLFTCPSILDKFISDYGELSLKEKEISVIGMPTKNRLKKYFPDIEPLVGKEVSVESMVEALAISNVKKLLKGLES